MDRCRTPCATGADCQGAAGKHEVGVTGGGGPGGRAEDAALASKGQGGYGCKLDDSQLAQLRASLDLGPSAVGWDRDQRWTLARVAALIARLSGVPYTLWGVSYLLHRLGFTPQVAAHRAAERDEDAIAAWRSQEYLPGHNRRRFDAHLRFVTGEVVPWAGEQFGPIGGPWVAAGFSSGAGWAIVAAQRLPDVFGTVAGFSAGVVPQRISGEARSACGCRQSHPHRAARRYSLIVPPARVCLRTRYCPGTAGCGSGFSGAAEWSERCGRC